MAKAQQDDELDLDNDDSSDNTEDTAPDTYNEADRINALLDQYKAAQAASGKPAPEDHLAPTVMDRDTKQTPQDFINAITPDVSKPMQRFVAPSDTSETVPAKETPKEEQEMDLSDPLYPMPKKGGISLRDRTAANKAILADLEKDEQSGPKPVSGMADSEKARSEVPGVDTQDKGLRAEINNAFEAKGDDTQQQEAPIANLAQASQPLSLDNLTRMSAPAPGMVSPDMAAAQDRSNQLSALMMMGKGAEKIGSALARTKSDPNYLNEMQPMINKPVEDLLNAQKSQSMQTDEQVKLRNLALMQDADQPDSKVSDIYRKVLKDNFPNIFNGVDADSLSASQMEQVFPPLRAFAEAQMNRDAKQEIQDTKNQGRQAAQDDKKEKQLNDADAKYTNALMQMKGDKALNNQRETIRRVNNAMSIINNPQWKGNLNNMPQPMVNMVNEDLNFIMQGGVGGQEGFKNISNPTTYSKLAGAYAGIANKPTGAAQGEFVKQNQSVLMDLKKNAEDAVRQRFNLVDNGFGKAARPETREAQKKLLFPEDQDTLNPNAPPAGTVTIRRKKDGVTKTLSTSDATDFLKDPNYELVK